MNLIEQITTGNFQGHVIHYAGITHYKFDDCKNENLVDIDGYKVHKKAAEAFEKMKKDAIQNGIQLEIVSAFRSIEYQKTIFPIKFGGNTNPKEEDFIARLKYSAPPGFSEHHTGLAIDINSLEEDFAESKEYEWLLKNAHKYGFEMSFPKNNHQGVGFEPWHWRFVGDEECKNILYKLN